MTYGILAGVALCMTLAQPPEFGAIETSAHAIPQWAVGARWYHLEVDRFRNGDTSNDPSGVRPWPSQASLPDTPDSESVFGGDIQGVQEALPYLKRLGVNALILEGCFAKDFTCIEDRAFLAFLGEAHRQGFHVMPYLEVDARPDAATIERARHWFDPNGDGDPRDGMDGYVLRVPAHADREAYGQLAAGIKKITTEALLVGNVTDAPGEWLAARDRPGFDVLLDHSAGEALARLFAGKPGDYTPQHFFEEIAGVWEGSDADRGAATLRAVSGAERGRLLSRIAGRADGKPGPSAALTEAARNRWRFAMIVHQFLPGAPVTYYGDELGMGGVESEGAASPMRWGDTDLATGKPPQLGAEFHELTRLLHQLRERFEPIRRGRIRPILLDESRRILAFSRSLPGEEVTIVINYGKKKQRVRMTAHWPRQLVALISPQIRPSPKGSGIFRLGGSRQQADGWADVTFWVNAMSLRLMIVTDEDEQ